MSVNSDVSHVNTFTKIVINLVLVLYQRNVKKKPNKQTEKENGFKSANISRPPLVPRKMTSQHRNSTLMTRHYSDLGSASDWLRQISHAARPISTTAQAQPRS